MTLEKDCSVVCKSWREKEGKMTPNREENIEMNSQRPSTGKVDTSVDINDPKNRVLAFEDALKEIGEWKCEENRENCVDFPPFRFRKSPNPVAVHDCANPPHRAQRNNGNLLPDSRCTMRSGSEHS
jgi:hypothetical protein